MVAAATGEDGGPSAKRARGGEEPGSWPQWPAAAAELEAAGGGPGGCRLRLLASVEDAAAPRTAAGELRIATGIAFLDHMVDQLTAHAQLRVGLRSEFGGREAQPHSNELAQPGVDDEVARLAGGALGRCLRQLRAARPTPGTWRFCAPLDEAFTSLTLEFGDAAGSAELALAPYGIYPRAGRSRIGSFRTVLTETFFGSLAEGLGCRLVARKVRGANAHHVVEATFKSFARCFRRSLDAASGYDVVALRAAALRRRLGERSRATKETSIEVKVDLDAAAVAEAPTPAISTGVVTLDGLLGQIQEFAQIGLHVQCRGDRWIDEHHSAEDVAITLGQALASAFGDKAGFTRMGFAEGSCNGASVLCVMDISNRPCLVSDLRLDGQDEEMVGDISVEMIEHVFESLVSSALITVHLLQQGPAEGPAPSAGELATAAARALGAALRECLALDPRRGGAVSSSKGTLSK